MSDPVEIIANLLGAASLGINDEMRKSVEYVSGLSGEGAGGLLMIAHQPGISIKQLAKIIGLSHPGTVRLVDRLYELGLVERRSSELDKRSVRLFVTNKGAEKITSVKEARIHILKQLVQEVSPKEQEVLKRILGLWLQKMGKDDDQKLHLCRLCDAERCPDCPILVEV